MPLSNTTPNTRDVEDPQSMWDATWDATNKPFPKKSFPYPTHDSLKAYNPEAMHVSSKLDIQDLPVTPPKAKDSYPYPAYESWKSMQASKAMTLNDLSVKPPTSFRPQLPSPAVAEEFTKKEVRVEKASASAESLTDFVPSRPKIDEPVADKPYQNLDEITLLRAFVSSVIQQRQTFKDAEEVRIGRLFKNQEMVNAIRKENQKLKEEESSNASSSGLLGLIATYASIIGVGISILSVLVVGFAALPGIVVQLSGTLMLISGITQAYKLYYDYKSGENQKAMLMKEYEIELNHRRIRSGANQIKEMQTNDINAVRLLKAFIDSWNRTIQSIMQN